MHLCVVDGSLLIYTQKERMHYIAKAQLVCNACVVSCDVFMYATTNICGL